MWKQLRNSVLFFTKKPSHRMQTFPVFIQRLTRAYSFDITYVYKEVVTHLLNYQHGRLCFWVDGCSSADSKVPSIYGIQRFITEFQRDRHWYLTCARWIHTPLSLGSGLILVFIYAKCPKRYFSFSFCWFIYLKTRPILVSKVFQNMSGNNNNNKRNCRPVWN
jgi:hypothetical protein